jgi:hypothetical protein
MLLPLKRGFWELEKDLKNKERVIMACEPKQLINDTDHMWQLAVRYVPRWELQAFSNVAAKLVLLSHFPSCHSIISSIQQTDHNTCTHRHTPSLVC